MMVDCTPHSHNSRQAVAVVLCCENGNTPSDSIKGWVYLNYLSNSFIVISAITS
jgi:hypothetical protein